MRKNILSFISGAICMAVLSGGFAVFASGAWKNISVVEDNINVVVDGKQISESNFVYNDRTYLPLRAVAEAVGKEVTYDAKTNTAYIGELPALSNVYYTGFDVKVPDYSNVTGVPLKERIDIEDSSIFYYEYTSASDYLEYTDILINEGFKYVKNEDKTTNLYFVKENTAVIVGLELEITEHMGDISIMVIGKVIK